MDTSPFRAAYRDQSAALEPEIGLVRATESLTAKRIGTGAALDRWYPYYAGFSQRFAAEIIAELCGSRACTVLDPWNGSGTTTAAAFHAGHRAIGFDLNPATLVVANAKLVHRAGLDAIPSLLEKCFRAARRELDRTSVAEEDPLALWLPPRASAFARQAFTWLRSKGVGSAEHLTPTFSVVAVCLLRALRFFAVDVRSNSSWALPHEKIHRVRIDSVENLARSIAEEIKQDRHLLPQAFSPTTADVGDARAIDLPANSVDVVLTSPPYCTRIDYAKQSRFELAALFKLDDRSSRGLRNELMGTTSLRDCRRQAVKLPASIVRLLDAIRRHTSHRSAAYYHKNIEQYFTDASLAVKDIARVLRPGGRAALVLQNSYYKEIPVPLSDLFCDLGGAHGLVARVIVRKAVGRSMTSVNTRSRKYKVTRTYSEDLVLMEKKR